MRNLIAVLVLAAVFIGGCETLQSRSGQTVVTLVSMRVIENAGDPASKAAQIRAAVERIEGYLADTQILTLAGLEAIARKQLNPDLPPSEAFLWEEAIMVVMQDLAERTPVDGVLTDEARAAAHSTLASITRAIVLEGY